MSAFYYGRPERERKKITWLSDLSQIKRKLNKQTLLSAKSFCLGKTILYLNFCIPHIGRDCICPHAHKWQLYLILLVRCLWQFSLETMHHMWEISERSNHRLCVHFNLLTWKPRLSTAVGSHSYYMKCFRWGKQAHNVPCTVLHMSPHQSPLSSQSPPHHLGSCLGADHRPRTNQETRTTSTTHQRQQNRFLLNKIKTFSECQVDLTQFWSTTLQKPSTQSHNKDVSVRGCCVWSLRAVGHAALCHSSSWRRSAHQDWVWLGQVAPRLCWWLVAAVDIKKKTFVTTTNTPGNVFSQLGIRM